MYKLQTVAVLRLRYPDQSRKLSKKAPLLRYFKAAGLSRLLPQHLRTNTVIETQLAKICTTPGTL